MSRSNVDFPQPLGPTNETSSLAAMENDMPLRASRLVPGASGSAKLLEIACARTPDGSETFVVTT